MDDLIQDDVAAARLAAVLGCPADDALVARLTALYGQQMTAAHRVLDRVTANDDAADHAAVLDALARDE